jgi:DNA repair protein RadB
MDYTYPTHQTISSGSDIIDSLLEGGYEKDTIITIYGPTGSGKTNLCLLAIRPIIEAKKKVIYIDTEGGFSIKRLSQIYGTDVPLLDSIMYLQPTSFDEQKKDFSHLSKQITDDVGLIIIDSISMLYRLELGKNDDVFEINRELGQQIALLNQIVRKHKIPILLTNQVYADFDQKNDIKMVAGNIIKYSSKCLLELQRIKNNRRRIILRKHRSIKEDKDAQFTITQDGIQSVDLDQ